ncbi:DUF6624 domain-containing protein [Olivibacter sp. CPCC 100613]
MKFGRLIFFLFFCFLLQHSNLSFAQSDTSLTNKLIRMAASDQKAIMHPPTGYELGTSNYERYTDSVFESHYNIVKKIFTKYGFPGYRLVGKDGAKSFWLIVQHCDKWPKFQEKVLRKMRHEVLNNNASGENYAFLVDRVRKNKGEKQVFGTQVSFDITKSQAHVKDLEDPEHVNQRRTSVGLESLESYLNRMSINHYNMNKKVYQKKGIKGPTLYQVN